MKCRNENRRAQGIFRDPRENLYGEEKRNGTILFIEEAMR